MPKETKAHLDTENRPERVSLADQPRNILTVLNKDDEYFYYWFNDVDDRIAKAELGGYDKVTYGDLEIGEKSIHRLKGEKNAVVTQPIGNGKNGVLMRIKKEWHTEDQAKKHAEILRREQAMVAETSEGRYGAGLRIER